MSADSRTLHSKLKEICGLDFVFDEPLELKYFSIDGLVPRAVVAPGTTKEARAIVALARDERLTIIPRGGGLHIKHGYTPEKADLVVLTSRLGQVLELEPENLTAVVESGIPLSELEHRLAKQRVFFPINPYRMDMCTPGGAASTNASGPRRIRFGTMRDRLLGIKVITGEAELVSSGAKTVKNVAGYDLSKLIIGSLGTLGLITEMTIRLEPFPEKFQAVMGVFKKLSQATAASQGIIKFNPMPCFLELLCPESMPRIYPVPGDKPAPARGYTLVAGSEGLKEVVEHQTEQVHQIFRKEGAVETIEFSHGFEAEIDWLLQEAYFEEKRVFLKVRFPPGRMQGILEHAQKLAKGHQLHIARIASAGVGTAHIFILHDEPEKILNQISGFIKDLREFCAEIEGGLVVMNAPLKLKQDVPVFTFSSEESEFLKKIKSAFDPDDIFSPARMF